MNGHGIDAPAVSETYDVIHVVCIAIVVTGARCTNMDDVKLLANQTIFFRAQQIGIAQVYTKYLGFKTLFNEIHLTLTADKM